MFDGRPWKEMYRQLSQEEISSSLSIELRMSRKWSSSSFSICLVKVGSTNGLRGNCCCCCGCQSFLRGLGSCDKGWKDGEKENRRSRGRKVCEMDVFGGRVCSLWFESDEIFWSRTKLLEIERRVDVAFHSSFLVPLSRSCPCCCGCLAFASAAPKEKRKRESKRKVDLIIVVVVVDLRSLLRWM